MRSTKVRYGAIRPEDVIVNSSASLVCIKYVIKNDTSVDFTFMIVERLLDSAASVRTWSETLSMLAETTKYDFVKAPRSVLR